MRTRQLNNDGSLAVLAIAGNYVITLGMNLKTSLHTQLLGFSIQRTDQLANKTDWLTSFKVFQDVLPDKPADVMVSTEQHPIQDFFWSDFTVRPGRSYTYRIVARGGTPRALTILTEASVRLVLKQRITVSNTMFISTGEWLVLRRLLINSALTHFPTLLLSTPKCGPG